MATAPTTGKRSTGSRRTPMAIVPDTEVNSSAGKDGVGISAVLSPQKSKRSTAAAGKKKANEKTSITDELADLQGQLERLRIEKDKADELLKEKEKTIQEKEDEIEKRGKEQERLHAEVRKLHKMKEFNPTVSLPLLNSLMEQDGDENENKRKNKHANERKRPATPYALWCKDQWNDIKKENTEAEFKEVTQALGAKWKGLTAEEKMPYEEKYKQEKEAYLQVVGKERREAEAMKLLEEEQMQKTAKELLEQYIMFRQEVANDGGKKAKKVKDPSKPKQPMSAFFVYSQERREALVAEKKNVTEIAKIAGEEWKNMTEAQKAPYEEVAKGKKEEYQQQMEVYNQKKLEEAASLEKEEEEQKKIMKQEALQLLKKKEKTDNLIKKTKEQHQKKKGEQAVDPNKPKRPASSFFRFSKEARKQLLEERPGINNSTLTALISVKWKEMSDGEKQVWNDKAAQDMTAYKKELEEYNKTVCAAAGPSTTA